MRALLLSASPDYYSTRKILDAFEARNHEIRLADPGNVELGPGGDGRDLAIEGEPAPAFDLCLPRLSKPLLDHIFKILGALDDRGCVLLNSLEGLHASRDKYVTYQRLSREKIPTPSTTLVVDPGRADEAARRVGGFPVVLKPLHATQGSGVTLVRDARTAAVLLERFLSSGEGAVFQTFLPEAAGSDIRLITLGPRILGAMRRRSAIGDFRSNLHQGGSAETYDPPDVLKDLASRAAGALGLRFAGVDVLVTRAGFMVLEVNASPGLGGFEKSTGVDVASKLAEMAERILAERR
jgi:ribosomal protein S6--L-glutamate ligase